MPDTFEIAYLVTVQKQEQIHEKIEGICLEQSAELPRGVLTDEIQQKVVGKPTRKEQIGDHTYEVTIAWPCADVGDDIAQFLNILYGNISLQPGIKITGSEWSALYPKLFRGPAFGIEKLRKRYGVPQRSMSATALKPMGSSVSELADCCYQFACGGIDIIKDDHGLADQEFAPFEERIKACVSAVEKAADSTGRRSYYYPNVTAFASEAVERYRKAAELGADGVLLCPHIAGLETMHRLAQLDIDLPIMSHPSFSGGLTTIGEQGLSPDFLYGQLWRALGADFVIYPNKGGRFSFSLPECKAINDAARSKDSPFLSSFPTPGGGIDLETVNHWKNEYGTDVDFLIGGSLYEHPEGIEAASKLLQNKLQEK